MAHNYSPLKTSHDGDELFVDPKEAKKQAKIRDLQSAYDKQRKADPTLETSISFGYSYLSMAWLSPFMKLGALKKLETGDIAELTNREKSENVKDRFQDVRLSSPCLPPCLSHR